MLRLATDAKGDRWNSSTIAVTQLNKSKAQIGMSKLDLLLSDVVLACHSCGPNLMDLHPEIWRLLTNSCSPK